MSENWYPVIDYSLCEECGSCILKCSKGVYDQAKSPSPKVVFKEGCVQGCHGCGNLCPVGAIAYVGDNTGWSPQNKKEGDDCGCECDCSSDCGC